MKELWRVGGGWLRAAAQFVCCCRQRRESEDDTRAEVEVKEEETVEDVDLVECEEDASVASEIAVVDSTSSGCAATSDNVEVEDSMVVVVDDDNAETHQETSDEAEKATNSDNTCEPLELPVDAKKTVVDYLGNSMVNRGLARWQRVMAIRQSDPLRQLIAYDLEHAAVLPLMRAQVTEIQRRLCELMPGRLMPNRSNASRHSV